MGGYKKMMYNDSAHTGGPFCHERDEPTDNQTTELQFGKYRGQDISDVYDADQQYAKWLYTQEILIGEYPAIKSFLHDKFVGADLSFVMRWGKSDPNYISWLAKNEFVQNKCPALKRTIELLE
ncbi:hypothetical protein AC1031_002415 [Aphanomyces cochlioides]|nr:hypothetical protein AC1031_002415 [Aphanomyces cochlioides]